MADGGRRDPMADLDPTVRDLVSRRQRQRKKPRYPSEEERVKATWDVQPTTLARMRAAAAELGVAQYSLVEKLINEGLDRWEMGEIELRRVAVVTSWRVE